LAWLHAHGRPRFPIHRQYRETFDFKKQDPKEHAKSLEDYIRLAPHLIPADPQLNTPILRHPDLRPSNILVAEDFSITGIIDWQHSMVLPTFLATGIPKQFQNYGDEGFNPLDPPKLPDDLESMDEEERAAAEEQFRRRQTHFAYYIWTSGLNKRHWRALHGETSHLKRRIFNNASNPWEGLNTLLQVDIDNVVRNWPTIACPNSDGTVPPCPVAFDEEGAKKRAAIIDSLGDADADMEVIREWMGITLDGWTPHELYESAKENALIAREKGISGVEEDAWLKEMSERHWPFDDQDEDE
jgi:hypothetical protein